MGEGVAGAGEPDRLVATCDAIDRLVTVEMRLSAYSRGVIEHLYGAARERQGGGPLSLLAARTLTGSVGRGDAVFVATGAGVADFLPDGETDGPPGAVALANALSLGLGAVPLLLTEAPYADNLARTALAGGLGTRTPEVARRVPGTAAVLPLASDGSAEEQAADYLERYRPAAVIAVEKIGPNSIGVAHTATGKPAGDGRARFETVLERAREGGIPTIGIGDNGNEFGFGLIEDAVRRHKPYGDRCQCPCGAGLATSVVTDVLVPANTSNWGAYGVAAALAALLGRPEVFHDEETERRTIEACVEAGAVDGSTGRHVPKVDGSPLKAQIAVVTLLRTIVVNGLARPSERPY